MTTNISFQDNQLHGTPPSVERYTIEQLARSVGMSPRNIRAHQTRKLIDPPVREGRTAYYGIRHLRRLETIQSLQEQGFNLVAIEAILCGSDNGGANDDLTPVLHGVDLADPQLVSALGAHGVVDRTEDGTIRPLQVRMLRSALDLHSGLSPTQSLRILVEVLNNVRTVADELGQEANARILALRGSAPAVPAAWDRVDRGDDGVTPGLADLLMEAFRLTVGNQVGAGVGQRG